VNNVEWLVIGQIFTFLAAVFAYLQSLQNAKNQKFNDERSRNAIQEIHLIINSRWSIFQEQTEKLLTEAYAKGVEEGRG